MQQASSFRERRFGLVFRPKRGGKELRMRVSIVEVRPSGKDIGVEVESIGGDQGSFRMSASQIAELVDEDTGEVVEDAVRWLRFIWFEQVCDGDGAISLDAVIDALPINGLGPDRSRRLARAFEGWDEFLGTVIGSLREWHGLAERFGHDEAKACSHLEFLLIGGGDLLAGLEGEVRYPLLSDLPNLWRLLSVEGVGLGTVRQLITCFEDPDCLRSAEEIGRQCRIKPIESIQGALSGLRVVFTGVLKSLSRAQAKALAQRAGATVAAGLARDTDLLVAGEGAGRKLTDAEGWGVRVVDEATFRHLVGLE